jgi:hypothetical protein
MFKPSSFKTAFSFQNRLLNQFDGQIRQQKLLLESVRKVLPNPLASHVQHALLTGKKLLIYTESSAWAAQLRFCEKAILAALASSPNNTVTHVQIKLAIDSIGASVNQKQTANIPTPENVETLRSLCQHVSDPDLTISLMKLTTTLERLSTTKNNDSD